MLFQERPSCPGTTKLSLSVQALFGTGQTGAPTAPLPPPQTSCWLNDGHNDEVDDLAAALLQLCLGLGCPNAHQPHQVA